MKTSTMIILGLGAWAGYRALAAKKAGVSVEKALTNPLTPVETLKAAQTAEETGQTSTDQGDGLAPLRGRRLLG